MAFWAILNENLASYWQLHPDLPIWILVFNLVPLSIFASIVLFSTVINFGAALVSQTITLVLCLAWLLPTLLVCSLSACGAYVTYLKMISIYGSVQRYRYPPTQSHLEHWASTNTIELQSETGSKVSKSKVL